MGTSLNPSATKSAVEQNLKLTEATSVYGPGHSRIVRSDLNLASWCLSVYLDSE